MIYFCSRSLGIESCCSPFALIEVFTLNMTHLFFIKGKSSLAGAPSVQYECIENAEDECKC